MAVASPDPTLARPSDSFDAPPELFATWIPSESPSRSIVAVCVVVAVLADELPVASLKPELARPNPRFSTVAVGGTTTTPMAPALRSRSWTTTFSAMLPVAVASPEQAQASPSEALVASPLAEATS
jgi:hypothetical protein